MQTVRLSFNGPDQRTVEGGPIGPSAGSRPMEHQRSQLRTASVLL